jgi:hypothetical protein
MPRKPVGSRIYGGTSDDHLTIEEMNPQLIEVYYEPSPEKLKLAAEVLDEVPSVTRKKLLEFGSLQGHFLTIYPLNTIPTHREFMEPKYGRIESITLDPWDYDLPQTEDDVWGQLEALPAGLTKDPSYGLGVQNDYRIIVNAIKQIPEVKHIVLAGDRPTSLDGDRYYLNLREFDGLRRAVNRIKAQKQSEGAQDKLVLARNTLLSNVLPHRFAETKRAYKPDTIFKLIEAKAPAQSLSKADRSAAVKLVEQSKRKLAEESPAELLQLKNDLELVSLEALIAKFEEMLGKTLVENQWQKLFNENPFILNMVFGYPVVKIRDQAHVGGQTLAGSGSTITDFLIKHKMSNNIALFEIKTPQTSLLNKTAYRGGLYSPASDVVGAISQILDQKYELQKSIASIKDSSRQYDIESYAVHGVLIVGRMPADPDRLKSFELFRANSKDVAVFTFDEVLEKLKLLLRFLSERSPEVMTTSKLMQLETRLLKLQDKYGKAFVGSTFEINGVSHGVLKLHEGVDGKRLTELMGTAGLLKIGFERARLGEPPFPLGADASKNRAVNAMTVEDFVQRAESQVESLETELDAAWPTSESHLK